MPRADSDLKCNTATLSIAGCRNALHKQPADTHCQNHPGQCIHCRHCPQWLRYKGKELLTQRTAAPAILLTILVVATQGRSAGKGWETHIWAGLKQGMGGQRNMPEGSRRTFTQAVEGKTALRPATDTGATATQSFKVSPGTQSGVCLRSTRSCRKRHVPSICTTVS